jgi:hypothetical protein
MALPQMLKRRRGVPLEIAQRTNVFRQSHHALNLHQIKCLANSRADSSQDHLPAAIRKNCNPCPRLSIEQEEDNYA